MDESQSLDELVKPVEESVEESHDGEGKPNKVVQDETSKPTEMKGAAKESLGNPNQLTEKGDHEENAEKEEKKCASNMGDALDVSEYPQGSAPEGEEMATGQLADVAHRMYSLATPWEGVLHRVLDQGHDSIIPFQMPDPVGQACQFTEEPDVKVSEPGSPHLEITSENDPDEHADDEEQSLRLNVSLAEEVASAQYRMEWNKSLTGQGLTSHWDPLVQMFELQMKSDYHPDPNEVMSWFEPNKDVNQGPENNAKGDVESQIDPIVVQDINQDKESNGPGKDCDQLLAPQKEVREQGMGDGVAHLPEPNEMGQGVVPILNPYAQQDAEFGQGPDVQRLLAEQEDEIAVTMAMHDMLLYLLNDMQTNLQSSGDNSQ